MCMQRHGPLERTDETRVRAKPKETLPHRVLVASNGRCLHLQFSVRNSSLPLSGNEPADAHANTINTTYHPIHHHYSRTRLHVSSVLQSALDRPTRG
jgi:hypothetical protein